MNLRFLFQVQEVLDNRILNEKNLKGKERELFPAKILALIVEIGELSNEHQSFKFWKKQPIPYEKDKILVEYVDGIHFFLSLGNHLGYQDYTIDNLLIKPFYNKHDLTTFTIDLIDGIIDLYRTRDRDDYVFAFESYLELGKLLGFTNEECLHAYIEKNQVNHNRQEKGY